MSGESSRQILRHQYRTLRRQLSATQQEQAASALLTACLTYPPFCEANTIACYLANDGEINPKYLIDYCWKQQKTVLLPVIHPNDPGHLIFIEHRASLPLWRNKYGIFEPVYNPDLLVAPAEIDIIFTPLVAFDNQGSRLGMGGGYYDRTLAALLQSDNSTQIIGLAHDCQQADLLPREEWDFPLHGIITPTQLFTLSCEIS